MLNEQDVSTLIESDQKERVKKNKKRVSWIDGKNNGKIEAQFFDVKTASARIDKKNRTSIHEYQETSNRYSFFSISTIGLGVMALGAVAAVGLTLSNK